MFSFIHWDLHPIIPIKPLILPQRHKGTESLINIYFNPLRLSASVAYICKFSPSGEIDMKILIPILLALAVNCNETSDNTNKQALALAVLNHTGKATTPSSSIPSSSCTSSFNCTTSPSFSKLAAAGTNVSCATSGCHTRATQQSGLDITDYNSTKAFTNPGNPCSSRMYTAITTGAMAGNSNRQINEAVYCWIAGGSNQ